MGKIGWQTAKAFQMPCSWLSMNIKKRRCFLLSIARNMMKRIKQLVNQEIEPLVETSLPGNGFRSCVLTPSLS